MNHFRIAAAVLAAATTLAATALAQAPVAALSTAVLNASQPAVSVYLKPNGTGTPLSTCYGPGGVPASATILVTLIDASGAVVPGYSNRNVRINHLVAALNWCSDAFYPPPLHAPNCADGATNGAGQTAFTLPYHGGGSFPGPTQIWVLEATGAWMPIPMPLAVSMNSADINGDLIVNLTDIVLFVQDLNSGTAPYRSDFNWDGMLNLSDIVLLAQANGTTCP